MAGDELESEVQAFVDLRLSAATSHERASAGDPLTTKERTHLPVSDRV